MQGAGGGNMMEMAQKMMGGKMPAGMNMNNMMQMA